MTLLPLLFLLFLGHVPLRAAGEETSAAVDAALKNRSTIKAGGLKGASKDVVERLKSLARGGDLRATVVLLNADEPGILDQCLADLREDHFTKSQNAALVLSKSNRPELILLLEPDLNRDEPATYRPLGDELLPWERVSFYAGDIIRGIIMRSKVFTPEVEAWAADIQKKYSARRWAREVMRIWLAENRALLKARKYRAVRPPSQIPPVSLD